ncbi:hypothetical protein [Candidatus Rariloculus sp.]|uniref:hypothetical protein n=1 Tax=Candidatus Rariloculus sp. TaxID=3101265 RepID=UPI003D0E585C
MAVAEHGPAARDLNTGSHHLGNRPPAEAEAANQRRLKYPSSAAWLEKSASAIPGAVHGS